MRTVCSCYQQRELRDIFMSNQCLVHGASSDLFIGRYHLLQLKHEREPVDVFVVRALLNCFGAIRSKQVS